MINLAEGHSVSGGPNQDIYTLQEVTASMKSKPRTIVGGDLGAKPVRQCEIVNYYRSGKVSEEIKEGTNEPSTQQSMIREPV